MPRSGRRRDHFGATQGAAANVVSGTPPAAQTLFADSRRR